MHGAELIAIALGLAVFGTFLFRTSSGWERKLLFLCLLATTPMSWLMFHHVRLPLDHWLQAHLANPGLLGWIRTAYAPLTEEPAKLWPLLIPAVRRAITRDTVGRFALALGLGFALGEIVMVGQLVSQRPEIAAMPWYMLGGFITERFFTCAIHPGMTALALAGWRRGGSLLLGIFLAMLAHYLSNFPITMAQRGWLGSNAAVSQALVSLWVAGCFFAAVAFLAWLSFPEVRLGRRLFGQAVCPECGGRYDRSVFGGFNAGVGRRYERCPLCKKWHWTQLAKPEAAAVV